MLCEECLFPIEFGMLYHYVSNRPVHDDCNEAQKRILKRGKNMSTVFELQQELDKVDKQITELQTREKALETQLVELRKKIKNAIPLTYDNPCQIMQVGEDQYAVHVYKSDDVTLLYFVQGIHTCSLEKDNI